MINYLRLAGLGFPTKADIMNKPKVKVRRMASTVWNPRKILATRDLGTTSPYPWVTDKVKLY